MKKYYIYIYLNHQVWVDFLWYWSKMRVLNWLSGIIQNKKKHILLKHVYSFVSNIGRKIYEMKPAIFSWFEL